MPLHDPSVTMTSDKEMRFLADGMHAHLHKVVLPSFDGQIVDAVKDAFRVEMVEAEKQLCILKCRRIQAPSGQALHERMFLESALYSHWEHPKSPMPVP